MAYSKTPRRHLVDHTLWACCQVLTQTHVWNPHLTLTTLKCTSPAHSFELQTLISNCFLDISPGCLKPIRCTNRILSPKPGSPPRFPLLSTWCDLPSEIWEPGREWSSVAEHVPSMPKALGRILCTKKRKGRKREIWEPLLTIPYVYSTNKSWCYYL